MDQPKTSIITRTRDREAFLARAVASVCGQEQALDWEWIVVNDGGRPEPVEEIMRGPSRRFPGRVHLHHLPASQGIEHASNFGISHARGSFLVIHDDDDSWDPAFLKTMGDFLADPAHAGYAGVACQSIRVEESVEGGVITIHREAPFNPWLTSLDAWRILEENPFPPISFLFRRSAYDAVGGFDETLPVLGDWEFNVRLILQFPLAVIPLPLARYHHRPPGETGATANTITSGHGLHRQWEEILRRRWLQHSPREGLPEFGKLAAIAGKTLDIRRRAEGLFSLPIRPGPQV